LSWTLSPATGVWFGSKEPNRRLGKDILQPRIPNQYGQIVNLLYVDYVEFARVADVAIFQNGERTTATAAAEPPQRSEAQPPPA
jgi:hypothetical protein